MHIIGNLNSCTDLTINPMNSKNMHGDAIKGRIEIRPNHPEHMWLMKTTQRTCGS